MTSNKAYHARFKAKHGVSSDTIWRRKNPLKAAARHERRKLRHRANPEKRRQVTNSRNAALRVFLLEAYGNQCACCGETEKQFLTFDHINNDGAAHRRKKPSNSSFYAWLRADYREEIQVLCFNCNCARGFYGVCPHTRGRSTDIPLIQTLHGEESRHAA